MYRQNTLDKTPGVANGIEICRPMISKYNSPQKSVKYITIPNVRTGTHKKQVKNSEKAACLSETQLKMSAWEVDGYD